MATATTGALEAEAVIARLPLCREVNRLSRRELAARLPPLTPIR